MPVYASDLPEVNKMAQGVLQGLQQQKLQDQKNTQETALKKLLLGNSPDGAPGLEAQSEIAKKKGEIANEMEAQSKIKRDNPDLVPQGGSVSVGSTHIGASPLAHMAAQGPHQATAFNKVVHDEYKPISEQLDASKSTLDALDQGNATSDKLALINEARLAAGQGGSRAISHMVDILSGGKTLQGTYQDKLNWLENTPNIPTMQPAQRDAIRESVFNRLPQLEQMHQQSSEKLSQLGPTIAPQANAQSVVDAYAKPAQNRLAQLKEAQGKYTAARAKMNQANPVSNPSEANPNPTTSQGLLGFISNLMGKNSAPAQAAQPAAAPPPPQNDPGYARYQELLKKSQGQ